MQDFLGELSPKCKNAAGRTAKSTYEIARGSPEAAAMRVYRSLAARNPAGERDEARAGEVDDEAKAPADHHPRRKEPGGPITT